MTSLPQESRYLSHPPFSFLKRPKARLLPILGRPGTPSVDLHKLSVLLNDYAEIKPMVTIQTKDHWESVIDQVDSSVDAILPLSNPAYPTEIWNADPHPLVTKSIPIIFWSLVDYDEPDFWRYAARDLLQTLGAEVYLAKSNYHGIQIVNALALRRFLQDAKMVVFGEQNFPWNAHAVGDRVSQNFGLEIIVHPIKKITDQYDKISEDDVTQFWNSHKGQRYNTDEIDPAALKQAVRTTIAIQNILVEEKALGFGVNCFGDLIVNGSRDVPCLAQLLLREKGFIAACDGDFIAMTGMVLGAHFLNIPCMTSNLYPVRYTGALTSHFGNPLAPGDAYSNEDWKHLGRLAHCGYVGVVSPEMTPQGSVRLTDWGGTYEIQRDGRGCGVDGELNAEAPITVFSLKFGCDRLIAARGKVAETTRHTGMPHCESSALIEVEKLNQFYNDVSRDHIILAYGDHIDKLKILCQVLGLAFTQY